MRTTRILSLSAAATATAAAVALPAPAALAQPEPVSAASVSLSPERAQPGMAVEIRVDCSAYADPMPGEVGSPGFTEERVRLKASDTGGGYWGQATAVAEPGTYRVRGHCLGGDGADGGSEFVAELTVATGPTHSPAPDPASRPAHPAEPVRPGGTERQPGKVDAGFGPGGPVAAASVAGVAVALTGVGGGLWLLRRRRC